MTCIVGIEQDGSVYIGADSSTTSDYETRSTLVQKVFRKGNFIIGYTSSFRMGQILQYQVEFPIADIYDEEYMVKYFVESIRSKFKEYGYARIDNNEETGGCFLVGVQGHLYEIAADYQVNHYLDHIASVGAGSNYALGAMAALEFSGPNERILKALEVATKFSPYVCSPFKILEGN